jgi:molybdenum cofactor guanylyltransferase
VADRLAATGVLLVGGASERFGSPKALAKFRGETLAERAYRTLSEVCEEVIAVGKADDALALPFPVLDDGAQERAPVFGVIAALRAATHETCIVLPVDCPLVTPQILGDLIGASAVPASGPLPGAYPKSVLPELELRVAHGELSLRGVNPTTIEVDDDLLLNVNTQTDFVVAASRAFDDAIVDRPVLTPDEIALSELASDFWATALWAAGKLRRGDVFIAVDSVNGAMKRSLVTLMSWHALSVDPETPVRDDGMGLERWADGGALSAFESAYAHYDLRDAARALWATVDLFEHLEKETARRLGIDRFLDGAELRRRLYAVVRDPRHGATL